MKTTRWIVVIAVLGVSASLARAQVTSLAEATGQCNDGTFTQTKLKSEACKQNGGVQRWFVSTAFPTAAPKEAAVAALTSDPAPTPLAQPAPVTGRASATAAPASGGPAPGRASSPAAANDSTPSPAAAASSTSPPPATPASSSPDAAASASAAYPNPADRSPLVWVNTGTKVYHCPADEWYGKTAKGTYMSETNAVLLGARPAHDTPCPK